MYNYSNLNEGRNYENASSSPKHTTPSSASSSANKGSRKRKKFSSAPPPPLVIEEDGDGDEDGESAFDLVQRQLSKGFWPCQVCYKKETDTWMVNHPKEVGCVCMYTYIYIYIYIYIIYIIIIIIYRQNVWDVKEKGPSVKTGAVREK